MGLRLTILYWWTPKYVLQKELANLSDQTNTALQELLGKYALQQPVLAKHENHKNVKDQRLSMANNHVKMVQTLEAAVGHEKAVKLGRETLFLVGENLGKQTRTKLGVGDSPKDLIKASKILYRVLGINFHIEWLDGSNAKVVIDRCALAERYSELTCEVLSATDEGVIKGLQPKAKLQFTQYITSGCKNCTASIAFNKEANA